MAREYPDVRANTVACFSLNDYEWMLAFEADELHRIVDLMRHLRGARARRHTRVEIPFYTGRRKPVDELVAALRDAREGPVRPGADQRGPAVGQLAEHLPGWEIAACPANKVADQPRWRRRVCPFGARIGAQIIAGGSFGLVHQFGVGLDGVDVASATELGVLVARVPGDAGGNADSCAELAVLLLLALARRLDESRTVLAERRWPDRPVGRSLVDATVLIVGLGAIGIALARRLAPFGPRCSASGPGPSWAGRPRLSWWPARRSCRNCCRRPTR